MWLAARSDSEPSAVISAITSEIRSMDHDVVISQVMTMDQRRSDTLTRPRFSAFLLAAFGALGLCLAAVGDYAVSGYLATQRTREIAIRMALGASPSEVIWGLLRRILLALGIGVAVGIVGALLFTRLLSGFLFGVQPADRLNLAVAAFVIGLAGFLGAYAPARHAATIDPMTVLRSE
jgi:ABC-type antimicrobial peptide transport system permease subunit